MAIYDDAFRVWKRIIETSRVLHPELLFIIDKGWSKQDMRRKNTCRLSYTWQTRLFFTSCLLTRILVLYIFNIYLKTCRRFQKIIKSIVNYISLKINFNYTEHIFPVSCINIFKPMLLSRVILKRTWITNCASFISQPPQFLIYRMEILRSEEGEACALRVASHQFQRSNTNGSPRARQGHKGATGINLDGASLISLIRLRR